MEKTIERTLNNKLTYRFTEVFTNFISTYCFYDNKWNHISKDFKSWEEVDKWCDEMNAPKKPVSFEPVEVPDDYYGRPGVYYGD